MGEDGLQLLLADLERPYECGAGFKRRRFSTEVEVTMQLPALAAAHGDAQRLICMCRAEAVAGLLLMASEAEARADARIAVVK